MQLACPPASHYLKRNRRVQAIDMDQMGALSSFAFLFVSFLSPISGVIVSRDNPSTVPPFQTVSVPLADLKLGRYSYT